MRTRFIVMLVLLLPILASAQYNNYQMQIQQVRTMHQQMNNQNQKWASERARSDQQWHMRTMMSQMNRIQSSENNLGKEEKNKKN